MNKQRLSRYLHEVPFIIWLDIQEWALILICYVFWIADPSFLKFGICLAIPCFIIPLKRRQARGYLVHLMYYAGFKNASYYPPVLAEKYEE
tara:strand:+ start:14341 stop:14613 length:273 start_codon:yes stop_codon:yes gene_type:complete